MTYHVVGIGASVNRSAIPPSLGKEGPAEGRCNNWSQAPPCSHQSQEPGLLARQEFEEDGRVENKIASASESSERGEQGQDVPIGRRTRYNSEDAAHEQGAIEGKFSSDHVSPKSPEKRTREHTAVGCDGERILEGRVELECSLSCSNGL